MSSALVSLQPSKGSAVSKRGVKLWFELHQTLCQTVFECQVWKRGDERKLSHCRTWSLLTSVTDNRLMSGEL